MQWQTLDISVPRRLIQGTPMFHGIFYTAMPRQQSEILCQRNTNTDIPILILLVCFFTLKQLYPFRNICGKVSEVVHFLPRNMIKTLYCKKAWNKSSLLQVFLSVNKLCTCSILILEVHTFSNSRIKQNIPEGKTKGRHQIMCYLTSSSFS